MLMRLPPSHVGYSTSGMGGSGVAVGVAVACGVLKTGSSNALTCEPVQLAGAMPGNAVSRQQVVKSRVKLNRPTAPSTISAEKINHPAGKRLAVVSDMVKRSQGQVDTHSSA